MSKILRKRQKNLARRRLAHSYMLNSTKGQFNPQAYKAPGSMTK